MWLVQYSINGHECTFLDEEGNAAQFGNYSTAKAIANLLKNIFSNTNLTVDFIQIVDYLGNYTKI